MFLKIFFFIFEDIFIVNLFYIYIVDEKILDLSGDVKLVIIV